MKFPPVIYLVGLPGSGKTTNGKFIANELSYSFVDVDDKIEESVGMSISSIFKQLGESRFREIERDELRKINSKNTIISTGGGAPCFLDNMEWMNENGFTLFLNADPRIILERTKSASHRPLMKNDPETALNELYKKRLPMYQQATFESSQLESIEILAELTLFLEKD